MSHETLKVGDAVEIISVNVNRPMPSGLSMGSRGTVVSNPDGFYVGVDYGLPDTVHSARFAIRKIPQPPPQREVISSWDDVIVWRPREVSHV